jgi:membrane protease YdiL (CAAX protease family)
MPAFDSNSYFDLASSDRRGLGRYVIGSVLIVFLWLLFAILPVVAVIAFGMNGAVDLIQQGANWVDLSPSQDVDALVACTIILLSVIGMLFATIIIARGLHKQPLRTLITARSKFDMSRFWKGGIAILILNAVVFTFGYWLSPEEYIVVFDFERMAPFIVLVLILTPFQAMAEEVFFRGYLTQGISALTGNLLVRLTVPAFLFMAFHSANGDWAAGGLWAAATYFTLALYLGILTYKSNGLEAAIGFHAFHNILAFTLVTSGGAGMPFATAFYVESSDYMASYLGFLPVLLVHYLVCQWLGLFKTEPS